MKKTPDEKQIEQLLENVPTGPGPGLDARLARAPWTPRATAIRRLTGTLCLALLAAASAVAVTPQGRAWAQELLRFFARTESDQLPLQPWQMTRMPTPTIPPPLLSLWEAEEQAGFDARHFIALPAGMVLQGARVEGAVISITYISADGACRLTLAQSLNGEYPDAAQWSRFPADEIRAVSVGELAGELVHDVLGPSPITRLRWEQPEDWPPLYDWAPWQSGVLRFELVEDCSLASAAYLDESALLRLAPQTVHVAYGDPLVSLETAESQAGFEALQLSEADAQHFILAGASYEPQYQLLMLVYQAPDSALPLLQSGLTVRKWPTTQSIETCDLCAAVGASAEVTTVSLRGTTGEYVVGVWQLSDNGPIWQVVRGVATLRWQEGGYWCELAVFTSSDGSQTMEELIAIADAMK